MRKYPRQQRSRELVNSLIEATSRVIAEEGLEAATTVRIAERCGVSVGSLYQYFECKEDLYDAVLEQVAGDMAKMLQTPTQALPALSLGEFVRHALEALWQLLEKDNARYLHVVRYWAQMDSARYIQELEEKTITAISAHLLTLPRTQPPANVPSKLYILANSALFTLVRYISDPPAHIRREELIEGLVEMAERLLGSDEQPKELS